MKYFLLFVSAFIIVHISSAQNKVNYNIEYCGLPLGEITMKQLADGPYKLKVKHTAGAEGKVVGFDMTILLKAKKYAIVASSDSEYGDGDMRSAMYNMRKGDSFVITNIRVDFGRGVKKIGGEYAFTII